MDFKIKSVSIFLSIILDFECKSLRLDGADSPHNFLPSKAKTGPYLVHKADNRNDKSEFLLRIDSPNISRINL